MGKPKQNPNTEHVIFLLRVTLGVCFLLHGVHKLGAMGGPGMTNFAAYLNTRGIYLPTASAYAVAFGELLCGLALAVGFFHRIASVCLIIIMVGAVYYVTGSVGYLNTRTEAGYEYNLALIAMAAVIFVAGPGSFAFRIEFKQNEEAKGKK